MIIVCVAPLISLLIGWLTIVTFASRISRNISFDLFLALGLGLAISGQITFYSFLLVHQFDPKTIIVAHGCVLGLLLLINWSRRMNVTANVVRDRKDIW